LKRKADVSDRQKVIRESTRVVNTWKRGVRITLLRKEAVVFGGPITLKGKRELSDTVMGNPEERRSSFPTELQNGKGRAITIVLLGYEENYRGGEADEFNLMIQREREKLRVRGI